MNLRRSICLFASCVMFLTACGATNDDRLNSAVGMLNIGTPAATRPTSPASPPPCHLASLRPDGRLPSPDNISPNTFMGVIRNRGHLVVGVDQNTKLLGYYNPNTKQFEGFDIDIAKEVAHAIFGPDLTGKIYYRALLTGQRFTAVQEGTVDIVADAATINCARMKDVYFSNVYFMGHERILVRKDSKTDIKSLEDLRGKPVCATSGSTALDNLKKKLPFAVPFVVGARTDCLVALQLGKVDGILTDDAILYGFLAQDPHTKLLPGNITDEPYGLAIAKDHPEFVQFVNAVLEKMRSHRWTEIWKDWFGSVQIGGRPAAAPVQPPACYTDENC
jgi:polar amino acid transport system substrate-binding protein